MTLDPAQLKSDLEGIFTDPHPTTASAAAQAWADAVDDYVKAGVSNLILILTLGTAALKTAIETGITSGTPAGAASGIKTAISVYMLACTFPPSGTCVNVDDPGGSTFDAALAAELAIKSTDANAKGNSLGTAMVNFVAAHRGNFPPPPDPNHHPIL